MADFDPLAHLIARDQASAKAGQTGQSNTVFNPVGEPPVMGETNTILPGTRVTPDTDMAGVGPTMPGHTTAAIPPDAQDPLTVLIAQDKRAETHPDVSFGFGEGKMPEWLRPIHEVTSSFNSRLADALGFLPERLNNDLRRIGMQLWDKPGGASAAIKKEAHKLGIATKEFETLEGQIGSGMFDGLVSAAATFAALPTMMAMKGSTAISAAVKQFGEFISKHPGLFLGQELGAGAGAEIANKEIGGPVAVMAGAAMGSFTPGIVDKGARALTYPIRAAQRLLNPEVLPPPVSVPGTRFDVARGFGKEQLTAEQKAIEAETTAAINRAGGPATGPAAASTAHRDALVEARDVARQQQTEAWAPFTTVPTNFPRQRVAQIREEFDLPPPRENLEGIMNRPDPTPPGGDTGSLFRGAGAPRGGPEAPTGPVTIGELMALRSQAQDAAARAFSGMAPNKIDGRAYNNLANDILNMITDSFPAAGSPLGAQIANARAVSTRYNDLFTRGAVGKVLRTTANREPSVAPADTVETMLRHPTGFNQVPEIAAPPLNQVNTLATAESAVRSIFKEVATASPAGAEKWMQNNMRGMSALASTAHDLSSTAARLTVLAEREQARRTSHLAKFVAEEPNIAIKQIMSSSDPDAAMKAITSTMKGNAGALESWRAAVTNWLITTSGGSAKSMQHILSNPAVNRAMRGALEPGEYGRLQRLIGIASRMENGEKRFMDKFLGTPIQIIFRIFGAQAGSTIAHTLGGGRGNIQAPAIVSGIARRWAQDLFKGIAPEELLIRAIVDPKWEKVLLSKLPSTTKEFRSYAKKVRRLTWVKQGIIHDKEEE